MEIKYLNLLSKEYPTIESVAAEMVNLSAVRSLPKGTEYFFQIFTENMNHFFIC